MRVGLIGFGTINRQVALGLADAPVAVLTRAGSLTGFLASKPKVVIEAASPHALRSYAIAVVESGATLIAASGAALLDDDFRLRMEAACREHGTRLYVPAGALAGLDALGAAAVGGLDDVTLRITDPAAKTTFVGDAVEGVRLHPARLNVAMATAITAQRTVQLAWQRGAPHELELHAQGAFGDFTATVRPRLTPDRLSHVVALSLLAMLRQHEDLVRRASRRRTDSAPG